MSLLGEHCAIVSLGMSCQTSHQLRRHADLLKVLLEESTLEPSSMPLDNVIAPPSGAAALLSWRRFLPPIGELVANPVPFWAGPNIYFWHDFVTARPGEYEMSRSGFEIFSSKLAHKAQKFEQLAARRRVICVISNTQGNLGGISDGSGEFAATLTADDVTGIADAAGTYFGRKPELVFVTRRDRFVGEQPPGVKTYFLQPKSKSWKGDDEQWQRVFTDCFH